MAKQGLAIPTDTACNSCFTTELFGPNPSKATATNPVEVKKESFRFKKYIDTPGIDFGYQIGFMAGIADGVIETVETVADIVGFTVKTAIKAATDTEKLIQDTSDALKKTRALVVKLYRDSKLRDKLWIDMKKHMSDFLDDATFQNDMDSAGYIHGKLTFDVLSMVFGIGEINAILKTGTFSAGLLTKINRFKSAVNGIGKIVTKKGRTTLVDNFGKAIANGKGDIKFFLENVAKLSSKLSKYSNLQKAVDATTDKLFLARINGLLNDPDKLKKVEEFLTIAKSKLPAIEKRRVNGVELVRNFNIKVKNAAGELVDVWYDSNGLPDYNKGGHSVFRTEAKNLGSSASDQATDKRNATAEYLKKITDKNAHAEKYGYAHTKTIAKSRTGGNGVDIYDTNLKKYVQYTWHHHQDGKTMQLVPFLIHRGSTHAAGVKVIELGVQNIFK